MREYIEIQGARENNLKNVSVWFSSRRGRVLFEGVPADLRNCKEPLTAQYI